MRFSFHRLLLFLMQFKYFFASFAEDSDEVLYATNHEILLYQVTLQKSITLAENLRDVVEIDFDYETQTLFYVSEFRKIHSMNIITKDEKVVLDNEYADIKHLSVDWITKKLYFTDQLTNRLEVCSFDGSERSVLFHRMSNNPKGLTVFPSKGILFLTDWGDNARIEKMNMDGTDPQVFVSKNILVPNVIIADEDQIYWFDGQKLTLESMRIDGTDRKVIFKTEESTFNHIINMAIVSSRIYFSNLRKNSISSCNKFNGSTSLCRTEVSGLLEVSSIKAYGKKMQPFFNSGCHIKNGGCSHLCLLKPSGYSCSCQTGYKLLKDGQTCASAIEKFILIATRPDLKIVSLDTTDFISIKLPISGLKTVSAVDFDPVEMMAYWTDALDNEYGVIKRAFLNGSIVETVVQDGYTLPDHLTIDWIARNLYWTCPKLNKIYVTTLDGSASAVIVDDDLDAPRGIAVDPEYGRLYWTDWSPKNPKIESSDLDGENRVTLVDSNLHWPNGITLDFKKRRIYWVDGGLDMMEYYDLNSKSRVNLKSSTPHMFGVSILDDFIYWTDWTERSLYKMDISNEKKVLVVNNIPDIMGVKAASIKASGTNACHGNAGCSHFCFFKPSGQVKCGCPNGYELNPNQKSCKPLEAHLIYSSSTSISTLSLEQSNSTGILKVSGRDLSFMAVHLKSSTMIWVENSGQCAIKRAPLNHTSDTTISQTGFYDLVGGLAIDQISANVYWSQQNKVEVSRLDGRFRKTIISTDRHVRTTLLALNPLIRKLYWIEETTNHSAVYESNLDGSLQRFIINVTEEVKGLAVDVNDSNIYWIGRYTHKIQRINPINISTAVVANDLDAPVGLSVYLDRLYFCESLNSEVSGRISSVRKENGEGKMKFAIHGKCENLAVLHTNTQTGGNICELNNGGCEQLCFAVNVSERICECETHYKLNPVDGTSCIGPQTFILISEETTIYRVVFSKLTEVPIHLNFPTYISSFEYNINTQTLYWLDESKHQILFSENGAQKIVDLRAADAFPVSFVIDLFTNCLYWIDGIKHTISYIMLNDSENYGTVFNKRGFYPMNLAILPEKGLLFFISEQKNIGHYLLLSIPYDGSNLWELQKIGLISDKKSQYDVAVDHKKERIYWLDKSKATVQSVDIQGQSSRLQFKFNSQKFTPVAISVFDTYLYWLDHDTIKHETKLKRALLDTEVSKEIHVLERKYKKVNDLLIVDVFRWEEKNPCKISNGGCSHICSAAMMKTGEQYAKCLCPLNFTLDSNDRKICKPQDEVNCPFLCKNLCVKNIVQCIEYFEDDCCSSGEFKCLGNGSCIRAIKVCDGTKDCIQGDDEESAMCDHFNNNFTKPTQGTLKPVRVKIYPTTSFSKYLAGIISGAILTTLMFVFGLYFCCKMSHRKLKRLKKEQEIYQFGTYNEQIIVLPDTKSKANNNLLPFYRYISGSSANVSDSIKTINPPSPSTVSTMMTSVSQHISNNYRYFYNEKEIPAPPATPLYMPSDIESVMTSSNVDVSNCISNQYSCNGNCSYCISKYRHKVFFAEQNGSRVVPSISTSFVSNDVTPSVASSYLSRHSAASGFCNAKVYYPRTKYLNIIREPPQWINSSNMHRIADEISLGPLPSLASDSGSLQNESSVSSIPNLSMTADSDCYHSYAPPPSPGTEYLMSTSHDTNYFLSTDNVFQDDLPCERDFLMQTDNERLRLA